MLLATTFRTVAQIDGQTAHRLCEPHRSGVNASSDAATVGQMNRTGSRLSGGVAAAVALGGAVVPDHGRTFVGASGATYDGQGGLAFGVVHDLDGSGLVLSGGVAFGTSGSQPIGRVAVGWLF